MEWYAVRFVDLDCLLDPGVDRRRIEFAARELPAIYNAVRIDRADAVRSER